MKLIGVMDTDPLGSRLSSVFPLKVDGSALGAYDTSSNEHMELPPSLPKRCLQVVSQRLAENRGPSQYLISTSDGFSNRDDTAVVLVFGGTMSQFPISKFWSFLADLVSQRRVIKELCKNDFRARYLGSFLGVTWAFVQPTVTVLIMWFVFEVGFRSGPVGSHPYVIWLMCGLLPWNFFSDALANGTNSLTENAYLVKKVVFRVSVLPVVKICSSLIVHLVFMVVLFVLLALYDPTSVSWHMLQIPYFLCAQMILLLGLTWMTSVIVVFVKDLSQIVTIVLQFGFWLTPVFWNYNIVPERYRIFVKLNPMFYIVEGYRNSLLGNSWFWSSPEQTVYFWCVCLAVFLVGGLIFMRLRPHLADVL